MALDPALERPHLADDPAFSDAVTCAFADERSGVQGTVRIGVAGGAASGLIMVFAEGAPVISQAEGGIAVEGTPEDYTELQAAGIDHTVVEPHRRWTVSVASDAGALDLTFEATGPALVLEAGHPAAKWGGMEGYEQPCRVTGSLSWAGGSRRVTIDGVGQRGHQWGAPDWSRLELARTVTGWFGDEVAFNVNALRPDGAQSHADEISWASVSRAPALVAEEQFDDEDEDDDVVPEPAVEPDTERAVVETPEPRISTTTDSGGRHTHATIELWESDEGPVWTATGEAVSGTTMELGRLRLDMAFFRWRLGGRTGLGRYDILRKVPAPDED